MYGSPADWLKQRLRDYNSYMANELPDDVKIILFVNDDGSVSDVWLNNMPTGSEQDLAFQNEVRRQVMTMPLWKPANLNGEPVGTFYTISIKELRP